MVSAKTGILGLTSARLYFLRWVIKGEKGKLVPLFGPTGDGRGGAEVCIKPRLSTGAAARPAFRLLQPRLSLLGVFAVANGAGPVPELPGEPHAELPPQPCPCVRRLRRKQPAVPLRRGRQEGRTQPPSALLRGSPPQPWVLVPR